MYTPYDPRSLDHHILTGHVVNAIKATKSINSIISTIILTQTISKTLKTANPEAVTKKKKCSDFQPIQRRAELLHWSTSIGLLGTGL